MTDPDPLPADAGPTTGEAATPDAPEAPLAPGGAGPAGPPPAPRPVVERLGMAAIALLLAALFAFMAVAAFQGGEPFLGVMSAIGCMMVLWVGGLTLLRGR